MHLVRLKISGFREVCWAGIALGRHVAVVAPNNRGKTSIIEALAQRVGRDRLVRHPTEQDFRGSAPGESARIPCSAAVTGFASNGPRHHPTGFSPERGVEKLSDPKAKALIERQRPT